MKSFRISFHRSVKATEAGFFEFAGSPPGYSYDAGKFHQGRSNKPGHRRKTLNAMNAITQ